MRGRKPGKHPPMPNLSEFGRDKPPGQLAAPHTPIKGKTLPMKKARKWMLPRRSPASKY